MTNATCSVTDCVKPVRTRGWCGMHYMRWWKHGDPLIVKRPPGAISRLTPRERFWPKVDKSAEPDGCWVWTASRDQGYGKMYYHGRYVRAHILAYEWLVGPIPAGLELDHLCRNHACVNPVHLEPVTHRENLRRGVGASALNAVKTHCPQGHEYTPENTRIARNGYRVCRACHREEVRRRKAAVRAARRAQRPST